MKPVLIAVAAAVTLVPAWVAFCWLVFVAVSQK
jgi:hypothetical protein